MLIDFRQLSVMRGGRLALDRLDLQIGTGERVAIIGPNGAGKSTLIKTITRECHPLVRPESSINIMGREQWDVLELRALLGIVSNDLLARCTGEFTGRDIVLSGYFSSIGLWQQRQYVTAEMSARADETMSRLEVSDLADRWLADMSSGEARRMLVARALVHDPLSLLFDEPSTSLDLFAQHELRRTIRILAQSGTGIVMVTHFLADIIPEIDRVILLAGGRVAADGPKAELLTSDRLARLFGVKVRLTLRDGFYHAW